MSKLLSFKDFLVANPTGDDLVDFNSKKRKVGTTSGDAVSEDVNEARHVSELSPASQAVHTKHVGARTAAQHLAASEAHNDAANTYDTTTKAGKSAWQFHQNHSQYHKTEYLMRRESTDVNEGVHLKVAHAGGKYTYVKHHKFSTGVELTHSRSDAKVFSSEQHAKDFHKKHLQGSRDPIYSKIVSVKEDVEGDVAPAINESTPSEFADQHYHAADSHYRQADNISSPHYASGVAHMMSAHAHESGHRLDHEAAAKMHARAAHWHTSEKHKESHERMSQGHELMAAKSAGKTDESCLTEDVDKGTGADKTSTYAHKTSTYAAHALARDHHKSAAAASYSYASTYNDTTKSYAKHIAQGKYHKMMSRKHQNLADKSTHK